MRRYSPGASAAAVALLLAVVVAGCSGGGDQTSAKLDVEGRTLVASAGGDLRPTGGRTVHAGDRVQVESGTATLSLSGGRQVEMAPGARLELQAGANGGSLRPSLLAGDVLVTAASDPTAITAAETSVDVSGGAARVQRGLAVIVASYTASTVVSSTGRSITVPPLRQVSVPAAGLIPPSTSPLAYTPSNQWDQRFLAEAIELGNQLAARSRGFTAQLAPGEGHTPGFYRQLLPALDREPGFDTPLLDAGRTPGETLVGLAIALQSTRGGFPDRLAAIYTFHDQGAAWGIVALDQGVSRAPLISGIDEAIAKGPPSTAERAAASAPTTRAAGRSSGQSTAGRTTSSGSVSAGPSPATSAPAPTASASGPVKTGVPLVDNTVNSLVDLLSGLLNGVGGK